MAKKTNCKVNGKASYRLRATIGHKSDGSPIIKNFYGDCQSNAERQRDQYFEEKQKELEKRNAELDKDITIGELAKTWIYEIKRMDSNIKSTSFDRYERLYRTYLKDSQIAALPMLTPRLGLHIQRYLNSLLETDKRTPAMLRDAYKIIHMFFIFALRSEYIEKDPCLNVVIPGEKVKHKKVDPFSDEESKRLIEALAGHRLRFLFLLALGTGLREGELLALSDSSFFTKEGGMFVEVSSSLANLVDIDRDGNRSNYRNEIIDPKSKDSSRIVPLPANLIAEYETHKRARAEECLRHGVGKRTDLIFATLTGTPIDQSNLNKQYKRILDEANIRYRKFHSLRHTYGTNLAANGVDLVTIKELMGHADIKTTMIYLHPKIENKVEAVKSLSYMFASI